MKYLQLVKTSLLALIVCNTALNAAIAADAPQQPYDGKYEIRRYGEAKSSGTLTLKQCNKDSVVLESFKLSGGHYQERVKAEVFSKNTPEAKLGGGRTFQRLYKECGDKKDSKKGGYDAWFEKGEHQIAEFILFKLQNSYLKLNLLSHPESTSLQFGVEDEYKDDNIHVLFHVDNVNNEPEFSLYIRYAYHAVEGSGGPKSGISVGYPMERFILIKEGSPRHIRMNLFN